MDVLERLANSIVVPVVVLDKAEDAIALIIKQCKALRASGETVAILIKGSHSIHMERVTEGLSAYLNS